MCKTTCNESRSWERLIRSIEASRMMSSRKIGKREWKLKEIVMQQSTFPFQIMKNSGQGSFQISSVTRVNGSRTSINFENGHFLVYDAVSQSSRRASTRQNRSRSNYCINGEIYADARDPITHKSSLLSVQFIFPSVYIKKFIAEFVR